MVVSPAQVGQVGESMEGHDPGHFPSPQVITMRSGPLCLSFSGEEQGSGLGGAVEKPKSKWRSLPRWLWAHWESQALRPPASHPTKNTEHRGQLLEDSCPRAAGAFAPPFRPRQDTWALSFTDTAHQGSQDRFCRVPYHLLNLYPHSITWVL